MVMDFLNPDNVIEVKNVVLTTSPICASPAGLVLLQMYSREELSVLQHYT